MKHNRKRIRGNNEDTDEKMRGRIRELEKALDTANRYAKHLEKKLRRSDDDGHFIPNEKIEKNENDKEVCCPKCGSPEYKSGTPIWTPNGETTWMTCKNCKHREKVKK